MGNKDRESERVEQVDVAVNRADEQVRQNKGQQEWDQSMMISPDDLSNAPLQALGTLPQRYLLTISKRYQQPVDILGVGGVPGARATSQIEPNHKQPARRLGPRNSGNNLRKQKREQIQTGARNEKGN